MVQLRQTPVADRGLRKPGVNWILYRPFRG